MYIVPHIEAVVLTLLDEELFFLNKHNGMLFSHSQVLPLSNKVMNLSDIVKPNKLNKEWQLPHLFILTVESKNKSQSVGIIVIKTEWERCRVGENNSHTQVWEDYTITYECL